MSWQAEAAPVAATRCALGDVALRLRDAATPMVFRQLVESWPAVRHCSESIASAARYLSRFWSDAPVTAYAADAAVGGRFFYNDGFTGFNFRSGRAPLAEVFRTLANPRREARLATVYVGSTPVDKWLPGFRAENDVPLPVEDALASFWLGNETRVSAHYDFPHNLACVAAGERRFTLFPPDQVGNLYVGPVDRTPSGQPISLVDFAQPDFERHPRFRDAIPHAQTAVLQPGDAILIPGMWWHHVESLAPFNLLINYWWSETPAYMGAPSDALLHAMLALRDLPARQREAWRTLFDHYIFDADDTVYQHIPAAGRGCLAPLHETEARQLRATLLNRLNR